MVARKKSFLLLAVLLISLVHFEVEAQVALVPLKSSWKYLDNGSNQGTNWRSTTFNDATWKTGNAELGYGDGDEATIVSFGTRAASKFITTYFRKTIAIADTSAYTSFSLGLKRDDGAIVYINGREAFRNNMPTTAVSNTTRASASALDDGATLLTQALSKTFFRNGNNVIAVEIHQDAPNSSDISFDLTLTAVPKTATNQLPSANAGVDQSITLPVSSAQLTGSGSDPDGTIASYAWSQVSGPATAVFSAATSASTAVTGLATAGTYVIRLTVRDNTGAQATDDINIVVNAAANQLPTANAGVDQSITLPVSSVQLTGSGSDPDGTIASYAWTQVSGPATAVFSAATSAATAVTGLTTAGNYIIRLTVRDNSGAQATDDINIVVNAAVVNLPSTFSFGSSWKYLDNGTDQGIAWRQTSFNDASWKSGNGELGYGDGGEATVVGFGANSSAKFITTYFRKQISLSDLTSLSAATIRYKRDDGIVIYINGNEVLRNNMPAGTILFSTLASAAASDDGNTIYSLSVPVTSFVQGTNTIAVEIHQNAGTSSDLSFDLEFTTTAVNPGGGSVQLLRGPYLQMATENSVVLRWRTDVATTSKVRVGLSNGVFIDSVVSSALNTDHVVRIAGLLPDTRYYYAIGNANVILQSGVDNYFRTAPPANTSRRMAFSVFGDCGRDQNSFRTLSLQSYLNNTTSNRADLMLLLGDNAYDLGTDEEYQAQFFTPYGSNILKNHVLFPAPGNHDYANNSLGMQGDVAFSYYRNFSVPTNAECGGVASGTKAYYSYNWGNVHFLSLDSYGRESNNQYRLYDTTSAQVQWIKNDLAANTRPWVVVYWHHPPYTMGSHNSDNEAELVSMRENLLTILERYGVDLILCGHSHNYERSYLLKNHYGYESTFNSNLHTVSTSSAKYDGSVNSCPYVVSDLKEKHGTVYVVSGSSGADGGTQLSFPHDAMPFSIDDGGMFYFEVEGNRLDAKFLHRNGTVADRFTIMKSVGKGITQTINKGNSVTLTASWIGNYLWSNGATTRSISVSPSVSSSYSVSDGSACIADQFQVNVTNIVSNQTDSSGLMLQAADGGAVVDLKFGRSRFQLTDSIVIVGLGSSTMSGTGASSWSKSFPGKLQSWLNTFNGKFVNLSTAGYNTTNVLPWGTSVNVKAQQNITSALSIRPDAIIIGLPTNDISAGLTPQQFRDNIMKLFRYATYSGIPCFIMSPNPRDDFSNARKQDLSISNQLFQDSIPEQFLINTFNLLRDSLSADPAKINPLFANGDLIHFNDSGHAVITQQVINKLDAYFQNMTGKVSLIQVEQGVVPDSASTPSSWQVLDQITDVTITEKKYPRLNNLWNAYRFRIQYSNGYTSPYSRMAYLKQSFARDSIDQVLPVDFAPVGAVKTNNRWNKFYYTSITGSSIALADTLGRATSVTLSMTKPFSGSSTLGASSSLAYPSEVSSDGWNVSTSTTTWSQLQFNNLDRNYAYELEFLGSYAYYDPTFFLGVWANGSDCNGSPMNLAANFANTYRKGIIKGLVPDVNNSITLDLYALGSQVSINGLILRRLRNKIQPVVQKNGVMANIKPMVGNSISASHDFYPNPVRLGSSFTVNSSDKGSILCLLFTQEGKVMLKRKFESTTQLSTVGLKPGMYMLHIISSQRTTTQKLIIQ